MTTIIGGKLMQVDKSAFRNVVKHTDTHNRIKEIDEMWKQREKEKNTSDNDDDGYEFNKSRRRRQSDSLQGKMYSDDVRDGKKREPAKKAGPWTKKLMEFEEADPDRWGHSGFKELYPEDFDSSEEQVTNGLEEDIKEKEGGDGDKEEEEEDIVEKWKRGKFRPRVESRRLVGGNFRGRGRRGFGRGRFQGPFQRNRFDIRRQEESQRRDQRERKRSKSHEDNDSSSKRLPGRFDRKRSRSESQENPIQRDNEAGRKHERKEFSPARVKTHRRDVFVGKVVSGADIGKRRSFEFDSKKETRERASPSRGTREGRRRIESDERAIESREANRTEVKAGDGRRERQRPGWDRVERSEEKLSGERDNTREREVEREMKEGQTVEVEERVFRGRWDKKDNSEDDSARALQENKRNSEKKASGSEHALEEPSRKVDMFGRDISKRFEYIEKKKKINHRPREVNQNKVELENESMQEERPAVVEKDIVTVRSPVVASHVQVAANTEEDGAKSSDPDEDGRKRKEKTKQKKKHKKKEKKKMKKKRRKEDRDNEDRSEDSNEERESVSRKDAAFNNERTEAAIAELNRIEKIKQRKESEHFEDDNWKSGFSVSLDVEAEMRERIKMKMKHRSTSLKSENVLNLEDPSEEENVDVKESNEIMRNSPEPTGMRGIDVYEAEVYGKDSKRSVSSHGEKLGSKRAEEQVVPRIGRDNAQRSHSRSVDKKETSTERTSRQKEHRGKTKRDKVSKTKGKARSDSSDHSEVSDSEYHPSVRSNEGKKKEKREVKRRNEDTGQEEGITRRARNEKHPRLRDRNNSSSFSDILDEEETGRKRGDGSFKQKSFRGKDVSELPLPESCKGKERHKKKSLRRNRRDSSESFSSYESSEKGEAQKGRKARQKTERSIAKLKRGKEADSESEEVSNSMRRGRLTQRNRLEKVGGKLRQRTAEGSSEEESESEASRAGSIRKKNVQRNAEKQARESQSSSDEREHRKGSKKEAKRQAEQRKRKKRQHKEEVSSDEEDMELTKRRKKEIYREEEEKIRMKKGLREKFDNPISSSLEDLEREIEAKIIAKKSIRKGEGRYQDDSNDDQVEANTKVNNAGHEAKARRSYSEDQAGGEGRSLTHARRWDVSSKTPRGINELSSEDRGTGAGNIRLKELLQAGFIIDDPRYEKHSIGKKQHAVGKSEIVVASRGRTEMASGDVKGPSSRRKDAGSSSDVSLYGDIDMEAMAGKGRPEGTAATKPHARRQRRSASSSDSDSSTHKDGHSSRRDATHMRKDDRRPRDKEAVRHRGSRDRDSWQRSASYDGSKRKTASRVGREGSSTRRGSNRRRSYSRSSQSGREDSRTKRPRDMARKRGGRGGSRLERSSSRSSLSSSSSAERERPGSKSRKRDVIKKSKSSKARRRDYSSSFESSSSNASSRVNRSKKRRK